MHFVALLVGHSSHPRLRGLGPLRSSVYAPCSVFPTGRSYFAAASVGCPLIQAGNNVRANAFRPQGNPKALVQVSLHSAFQFCHDTLEAPASSETQERHQRPNGNAHAHSHRRRAALVCRTQTEGHDRGQPRRRCHHLGAARAQRQPPRARLCRQGRQARRFRRDRPAQQQCVLRDHLCGVEMRRDADVADLAAAARRGCRRARHSEARRWWSAARPTGTRRIRCRPDFVPEGFSDEPIDQPGGAVLEGDDQRRLDRAAEGDPRSPARRDRHRRPRRRSAFRSALRCSIPARSITTRRSSLSHYRAVRTAAASPASSSSTPRKRLRLIETQPRAVGQFRADHDASDLGAAGQRAQPLRSLQPADRVSHGSSDAAMAEGKMDRVARARAHLRALWRHRAPGRLRSSSASNGSRTRARSARSARPRACASSARTATTSRPAKPARSISCPMTAPAAPITISAPSRSAAPTAGNRSATSDGSMPKAISISATASPT